jgi:hypothetical protein
MHGISRSWGSSPSNAHLCPFICTLFIKECTTPVCSSCFYFLVNSLSLFVGSFVPSLNNWKACAGCSFGSVFAGFWSSSPFPPHIAPQTALSFSSVMNVSCNPKTVAVTPNHSSWASFPASRRRLAISVEESASVPYISFDQKITAFWWQLTYCCQWCHQTCRCGCWT